MIRLSVLVILVSGLLMADVGTWKSFQTADKFFTGSFPCSANNVLVSKNENQTERMYKCDFAGSTYSLSQIVFTEAGKKMLQVRPPTVIDDTARDLVKKYRTENSNIDVHKIFRQHPYRRLEMVATGNKMKFYTSIFDGPEARIIFSASGPDSEDSNLKKASDSLKPN